MMMLRPRCSGTVPPLFSQSELKQEIDGWWCGVAMGTGARVRGTMIDGYGMAIAALLGARKRI
jgi:hypothetical protein